MWVQLCTCVSVYRSRALEALTLPTRLYILKFTAVNHPIWQMENLTVVLYKLESWHNQDLELNVFYSKTYFWH